MKRPGRHSLLVIVVAAAIVAGVYFLQTDEQYSAPPHPEPVGSISPASEDQAGVSVSEVTAEEFRRVLREGLATPGCETTPLPEFFREPHRFGTILQQAGEQLSSSDDVEHRIASALLVKKPKRRVELLESALAVAPQSALLNWHRLLTCAEAECNEPDAVKAAIEVDSGNGAVWMEIARESLANGNLAGAQDALSRAARSSRYDMYFIDHVMVLERGLSASTEFGYKERVFAAVGSAASTAIPVFSDVSEACQNREYDPVVWVPLCDELGEMMVSGGSSLMSRSIGLALRRIAAERKGDADLVRQFKEAEDLSRHLTREVVISGAGALHENDDAFVMRYIDKFAAYGEIAAIQFSIEEAHRLRADPTYDQCNFVLKRDPES